MRNTLIALLLLAASPAAAVTVTGISASGLNSGLVFNAAPGLLELDVAIYEFTPIVFTLLGEDADGGSFAMNTAVDIFTAVQLGKNVGKLSLTLGGASFITIGGVVPAFSIPGLELVGNTLTITFKPDGEAFGVLLGSLGGGSDFRIGVPDVGQPFTLTFNAVAVPEPASWAMMIAGFGFVGAVARRRRRVSVLCS